MLYAPSLLGLPDPQVLSTMVDEYAANADMSNTGGASGTWPNANQALFFPIRVTERRTYTKAWWLNGATAAGNVDVCVCTISGSTATKVGTASTAEAQSGTSAMQVAGTFPSLTLDPGLYYLTLSASLATATFWRNAVAPSLSRGLQAFSRASTHPLSGFSSGTVIAFPATIWPVFGLSELASI